MVNSDPPQPRRLVVEALSTGAIPGELSVILARCFRTVCESRVPLPSDKRSEQSIHSFLAQLVSGVDHIPGLEQVYLVELDLVRTVNLLH